MTSAMVRRPGAGNERESGPADMRPIVSVVDDDPAMLDSLRALLESVGHRVARYASARLFLNGFDFGSDVCGCIILDERMPGMTGHALHDDLMRRGCPTPIIVCTAFAEVGLAVNAMRKGAVTVIEKPFRPQVLLDAVHEALRRDEARRERSAKRRAYETRKERLTERQLQVMTLMVQGKANKAIAAVLGISERTVELHRARVLQTMHVDSTTELAFIFALHEGDGKD